MAAAPVFYTTPNIGRARIATANTNRDGSGTLGTVLTAGASGTRIERIDITATGSTTAGMVRLFTSDGTIRAWKEIVVSAITVGAGTAGFTFSVDCSRAENILILEPTWLLVAGTHNAESFDVTAWGFDA